VEDAAAAAFVTFAWSVCVNEITGSWIVKSMTGPASAIATTSGVAPGEVVKAPFAIVASKSTAVAPASVGQLVVASNAGAPPGYVPPATTCAFNPDAVCAGSSVIPETRTRTVVRP
jgi:hypothetical protein